MKMCPRCAGHGCAACDHQGVLPIAPYPRPYKAMKQQMYDWKLALPIERPEMLIWGSSLVVAAFMVASPRVVAGFAGALAGLAGLGVSDEEYMEAEERFQNDAYQFDKSTTCDQMRRRLAKMKSAYEASGFDIGIGRQYEMRRQQYKNECTRN